MKLNGELMSLQPNELEQNFIKTLTIQDVLLLNSEHNVYDIYSNQEIIIDFQKDSDLNLVIEEDFIVFEVAIKLDILDKKNDDSLLLSSKAKFAGIYSYEENNLEDENIEEFAMTFFRFAAVTHILAFCREYFHTIIIKSGYPRSILPLVNLLEDEAQKQASKKITKTKIKEK